MKSENEESTSRTLTPLALIDKNSQVGRYVRVVATIITGMLFFLDTLTTVDLPNEAGIVGVLTAVLSTLTWFIKLGDSPVVPPQDPEQTPWPPPAG